MGSVMGMKLLRGRDLWEWGKGRGLLGVGGGIYRYGGRVGSQVFFAGD